MPQIEMMMSDLPHAAPLRRGESPAASGDGDDESVRLNEESLRRFRERVSVGLTVDEVFGGADDAE